MSSLNLRYSIAVALGCALALAWGRADAQAFETASRNLSVSSFAGLSIADTGLESAGNAGVTAAGDLTIRPGDRVAVSLEVRGTYPIYRGSLVGQSNFMAGPSVRYRMGRVEPFADFLAGRGSLRFSSLGYKDPNHALVYYTITDGNVFAIGGGAGYRVRARWSIVADLQVQRYQTPVASSGHVNATTATLGLSYIVPLTRHHEP